MHIKPERFCLILAVVIFITITPVSVFAGLFGYQESERENLKLFPQWLSVLERNLKKQTPEGECEGRKLDQCHYKNWMSFLKSLSGLSKMKQIVEVNKFANQHEYILDIDNYGVEDYWATPWEFLYNNGDCEDYAIVKMISLEILGFNVENMRLVVLQDINLKVAHAVLAITTTTDTYIMDNQIEEVISHKHILHYVPVYALNENKWWLFIPRL